MTEPQSLQALIEQAKPLIKAALQIDEEKARAAGEVLLKIKKTRPKKRRGGSWDQFVKMHFGIGQQWADQMISIFERRTTRTEVREKTREAVRRHRHKVAAKAQHSTESPLRNGDSPPAPSRLPGEVGHVSAETPRNRFLRLCDEMVAACEEVAVKVPPANWSGLYEPLRRAADVLNALADKMEALPGARIPEGAASVGSTLGDRA